MSRQFDEARLPRLQEKTARRRSASRTMRYVVNETSTPPTTTPDRRSDVELDLVPARERSNVVTTAPDDPRHAPTSAAIKTRGNRKFQAMACTPSSRSA